MTKPAHHTPQCYVDAALELIADSGFDKLSMRKVASHMGVSAMAVYKHFPNKEALLTAALDCYIARAEVLPKQALAWRDWVEYVARAMYRALCDQISWVPMLGSMGLGPNALAVTDAFIERLTAEGFSDEQALQGYFAVIQGVVGAVCLQSSLAASSDDRQALSSRRTAAQLELGASGDQLSYSLPLIIGGLERQL